MENLYTSRISSPCYHCVERKAMCHSTCTRYSQYRKELEQDNAIKRAETEKRQIYSVWHNETYMANMRRH